MDQTRPCRVSHRTALVVGARVVLTPAGRPYPSGIGSYRAGNGYARLTAAAAVIARPW
jgi:hypothetical protein